MSKLVRALVGIGLTAVALWLSRPGEVAAAAASASLSWIAAALALVVVDRALMAYRWIVLLRAVDPVHRPPLAAIMRIFFVSTFLGTFLPSVGGDVVRAYSLARHGVQGSESAASVLMDRVLGAASIVVVALASLGFVGSAEREATALPLVLAAAACLGALAVVFHGGAGDLAAGILRRVPSGRVQRMGGRLLEATRRYASHRAVLANVMAGSIAVQVLRVVQAYCLGRALHIAAPPIVYFALIPLVLLVMLVPITIYGLGTSQMAFIWLFGTVGVGEAQAFTLSVLFLALGAVGNLPGGVIYAFGPPKESART